MAICGYMHEEGIAKGSF